MKAQCLKWLNFFRRKPVMKSISSKYEDMHRTYNDLYENVFDEFVRAENIGADQEVSISISLKDIDKLFAMDKELSEEYIHELKLALHK